MKQFKQMAAMWTFISAFFSNVSSETLIKDNEMNLTAEQIEQLEKALGPKVDLQDIVQKMNQELADFKAAELPEADQTLIDLRAEALKMLQDNDLDPDEAKKLLDNPEAATTATEKDILSGLLAASKEQDKKIAKLMADPEGDAPEALIKVMGKVTHNATHLFAEAKDYNAFEGRNWNQRAAGLSTKPTDFMANDGVNYDKLKGDLDLYYRENPRSLIGLNRDNLMLPSFWPIRTNVDDKVADGFIASAEITQARKKGWLPKNNQTIQPEEGQIFPVQIDIEFNGYELQKIEASWLNFMNREGSSPFKMTFVRFLIQELDKKARNEDRMVAINGVHVPTPDSATVPGLAIHRGDGISIQLWRARHLYNKFKSAQLGLPTAENICDYVVNVLKLNLPEEEKNVSGLVLYMSPSWVRAHAVRKRLEYGGDNNYTGQELMIIENYPNVKICAISDWEGTDYMLLTYDNNIELLENVPGERSMYRFDFDLRNTRALADYKWGSRVIHMGTEVKDTDPLAFKVQTVWDNGLSPFRKDFFVRLYQTTAGKVDMQKAYSQLTVVSGFSDDIENINNCYAGQVVRIKGNTLATGKVVDSGNISLTGDADFNLSSGGTLTLVVNADLTLTEVKRTAVPETNDTSNVAFDGTAIDANDGKEFDYTGGAATLASILNGYEGQQIVINGGAGGALTLEDVAGNIDVNAGAALANAADNITLTLIDGIWTEVARTIA